MNNSYQDYLKDQFALLGPITIRKMFGGAGIYFEGLMFGLIADDLVYLKVDESNKQDYLEAGMGPFTYQGKNKPIALSYYQLPDEILENQDLLHDWAIQSLSVAENARVKKEKPSRL